MNKNPAIQLENIKHLKREIELLRDQMASIDTNIATDKVRGSDHEFPYTIKSITISGVDITSYNSRMEKLKKKLEIRMQKLGVLLESANEFIENIEDSETRQIFTLRYFYNLTWNEIANKIGYADESVPRKKHNRFLQLTDISEKKMIL